jgi:hypothetical protein
MNNPKIDLADPAPCIQRLACAHDGEPREHRFLVRFGRHFTPRALPEHIRRGPQKECYATAAQLAWYHSEYTYVEGVGRVLCGRTFVPLAHAWCCDSDGNVVDPTWLNTGIEYFGVAFETRFVRSVMLGSGRWGIIFPDTVDRIARLPTCEWLHAICAQGRSGRALDLGATNPDRAIPLRSTPCNA